MKKKLLPLFCLLFVVFTANTQTVTWNTPGCEASNPKLKMLVFQGCTPSEGTKEFLHFTTGAAPWNVSDLTITGSQNSSITPNESCSLFGFSGNLFAATRLNAIAGCSIFFAANTTIPPNSNVLVIPNIAGAFTAPPYQNITTAQLFSLCGKEPIYVVGNTAFAGCTNGIFANINSACTSNCNKTIIVNFGSGCNTIINYNINDPAMPSAIAGGVNFTPSCGGSTKAITNSSPLSCFPLVVENLTLVKKAICQGENYYFNQQVLTKSGTYRAVFPAFNTCDSTVVLTLKVIPLDTIRVQKTLCSGVSNVFVENFKNNNGCDSTVVTTLNIATKLDVMISEQNKVLTTNAILSGVSYQWLRNGQAIVGANNFIFTAFADGLYCLEITDANGCKHKSNSIQIGVVATTEVQSNNILIYPNPTTGLFYIETKGFTLEKLSIGNLLGQKQLLQITDNQIDISYFPNGLYQLFLENKEGKIFCAKLMKQ